MVIDLDRIQPGDVLLVTPMPGEPLGEMITRLDGSGFSHSGIALGGDGVASAHLSFCRSDPFDIGGVRADRLSHFWEHGQQVYRLPVPSADRRAAALDRLAEVRLPDDDGRFCVPKLMIVAIALASFGPDLAPADAARVRAQAIEAARTWDGVADRREFFCAELVAHLHGARFTVEDLAPVDPQEPGPRTREGFLDTVLVRSIAFLADAERKAAFEELAVVVEQVMPTFFDRSALDILLSPFARHDGAPVSRGRRKPHKRPAGRAPEQDWLPPALVTPRMLLDAAWTGDQVERVREPAD
ncbi:hypothetical protein [Actinomycetospora chiangmaiensis]|uniref:hypothetical protein n=1 Tax=Actinomycetospora chiangmaiensis TaxID=402650 RepID=UPI0012FB2A62|nr:hypothetical protein [Actinomycetospora chiangmaiensis]